MLNIYFCSIGLAGSPVCEIGMDLCATSMASCVGAVIVSTPSEDNLDSILPISQVLGNTYLLTKCLEMKPCSSCFSSCLPSMVKTLSPVTLTLISSGLNCCTSKLAWNLSLSNVTVEPVSCWDELERQFLKYPAGVLVKTRLLRFNGWKMSSGSKPSPKCWSEILDGLKR